MNDNWKSDFEERLRAFDWASVNHAFGPATNVPDELMTFAEIGDGDGGFVLNEFFYTDLTHQQTRYKATLEAVPFLVELLEQLPLQRPFLIHYLVDIALGESNWHYPGGFRLGSALGAYMTEELTVQLVARVQDLAFPLFLRFANEDGEPKTQTLALWALSWFPAREAESRPLLETSPTNIALFALRMLDASHRPFQSRSEDEEEADFETYEEFFNDLF